jgi:CxxC-x17-CxxC domain-containing protein
MEFQDKVLKCVDCGADFVFTSGEQLFFHDKQFKNEPKRCKACKGKRNSALGISAGNYHKVETTAMCSSCEKETTVPFKPTQGRPVFCRECFQQRLKAPAAQAAAAGAGGGGSGTPGPQS